MFYKFSDAPKDGHVMPDFYYKRNLDKPGRTSYWHPRDTYEVSRPRIPENSNDKITTYNSWNEIRMRKQFPSDPKALFEATPNPNGGDNLPWNRTNLIQRKEPRPLGYAKIIPKSYEELYGIKRPEKWYTSPPPLHSIYQQRLDTPEPMRHRTHDDIIDDNHANPGHNDATMKYAPEILFRNKENTFDNDSIRNVPVSLPSMPPQYSTYYRSPKDYKYDTKINSESIRSNFSINVHAPDVMHSTSDKAPIEGLSRPGQNVISSGAYVSPSEYLYSNKAKPGASQAQYYQNKVKYIVPESGMKDIVLRRAHKVANY